MAGASDHRSADEILLVSTHTIDRIHGRGPVRSIPGGPAHYIGRALDRLGRRWRLITGEPVNVDAYAGPDGDEYVIPEIPFIALPPRLAAGAVILSPVLQEIDPLTVPPVDGLLVVDLQGFVRLPGISTATVDCTFDLAHLLVRADVVKAGSDEIERLTQQSREALRRTVVLETLGSRGAVIHSGESRIDVPALPVPDALTIGAGDTYLAAFVDALLDRASLEEAGRFAARFTEAVLRERTC